MKRLNGWKRYNLKILKTIEEKKYFKDFSFVLLFNTFSKVLNFIASTRAAKILGPENIGLSAVVQTTSTQISLFTDGGFLPYPYQGGFVYAGKSDW